MVGDPDVSFKEDPVRMLRAVKISVLQDLVIEKKTALSIKKNKMEIEKASTSRMLEEYNKIYRTMETANIFRGLAVHHLLEVLFKEALEETKKAPNWQENFLETNIGKRLKIADRKIKEREELTPVIYFALIFSDIVKNALEKEKGHMVPIIKNAIEPICKRLEIPKKDKERLIKTFASQKRFKIINENNVTQNELFKAKDFFYDSFMFFKINAEADRDEAGLQSAFFWEISARMRPKPTGSSPKNKNFEKRKKDRGKFQKNKEPEGKAVLVEELPFDSDALEEPILIPDTLDEDLSDEIPAQGNQPDSQTKEAEKSETSPKKKKNRPKRFRKFYKKPKKQDAPAEPS